MIFTDKTTIVLEWHQRRAIAIGTAKGLRFLHEECRGGPIIHRDMRPSNILLTHDSVPMVMIYTLCSYLNLFPYVILCPKVFESVFSLDAKSIHFFCCLNNIQMSEFVLIILI